jgi:UDP-N-acetylglucosamine--N-acetylmuramyl-(pentapeptide) pyrophosphoryl-undecaprenol N-acetylglucosamine transferase
VTSPDRQPENAEPVFAFVTGGGTGGHVYPALAVADELVRRGHARAAIRFVGSSRGLEATAVPDAGFSVELLPGRGLRRSLSFAALRDNAGALVGTARAFGRAFRLLGRLRPRVVLGVGGYASLPCVVAARLRRVPAVVHEQNAAPGLANRVGVRLGAKAAVSLPGTPLRHAILTGNPVRAVVASVQRAPEGPPLVAVVGGSLGAGRLNDAALGLYDRWRDRTDVRIRHVSGARGHDEVAARLASLRRADDALSYELVRYEDHMEHLYAAAALFVCRAGAVTVAELTATGTPGLLVPLPGAPGDHQTRNAEALVTAGAGVLVPDAELDGARLAAELDVLLGDPERLHSMGQKARTLAQPDAAARVADLVEEAARAAA